jgi:hypothetical protein
LVRASQRTGAGPSKDILNSDDSVASARPYGEAVQSNVLYVTLVICGDELVKSTLPDETFAAMRYGHVRSFGRGRL